jgi:hypothetical protein
VGQKSTNRKYGEALLDALTAYTGKADRVRWCGTVQECKEPWEYKEPWLAVLNCAAYWMAWHASGLQGYVKWEVSSVLVWGNPEEGDSLKALAHVVDLHQRDNPQTVICTWTPTDQDGKPTDFQRAAGGRLTVLTPPGTTDQYDTVVTRKGGNWAVWLYDLSKPSGGGYYGAGGRGRM